MTSNVYVPGQGSSITANHPTACKIVFTIVGQESKSVVYEERIKNDKIKSTKGQLENRNSSKVFNVGKICLSKAGLLLHVSQIFNAWWSTECSPF